MQQQPGYIYTPGFRFYPTDKELLAYYLQVTINNQNPYYFSLVNDFDIYSKDPWDIWDEFGGNNLVGEIDKDQGLFFFTELKKASDKKVGSNFARTVPKGRWHGDNSTPITDSTGQTIGLKKYFVYKNKKSTCDNEQGGKWKMHEISSLVGPSSNYVLCQLRKNDKDKSKKPELETEPAMAIRGGDRNHARSRQRFSYETNQGGDANFLRNTKTPEFSGEEETPVCLESSFEHPTENSSLMTEKPESETEPAVAIRGRDGYHARMHQRFSYYRNKGGDDTNFLSNTETPEFSGAEETPICLESSFEPPTENSSLMIDLTGESDSCVDISMSLDVEESLITESHTCASTKSDLQMQIGDREVIEYGKTEIADSGVFTSHVLPDIILDSQPTLQSSEEHPAIASTNQPLLPVDMVSSNHMEAINMGTGFASICLPSHSCDADDFIDWVQSLGNVLEIDLPFLLPESGNTFGFYNESYVDC